MIYKPHNYQVHAREHILEHSHCALFKEMGLGKTVVTLTAADILLNDRFEVKRWLVIAPLRVAQEVWHAEIEKWDHLKHLIISKILGTETQRRAAMITKADIYIINVDNLVWLISNYGARWPFDGLIIDESSKFKDQDTRRFKAIRKIQPLFKRIILLTGTPAPNSLMGLWSQLYLLDKGQRLCETLTRFRDKWFRRKDNGFGWEIREGCSDEIHNRIADICISMEAKDYRELPPRISNVIYITLPADIRKKYKAFEKEQVLQLAGEGHITAVNAGALVTKLLQFSNGAIYDADKVYHVMHDEKLKALEEIIEEANGEPVLVAYSFKSDLARILEYFKRYKPRVLEKSQDFKDWNEKKIQIGLLHPASGGHGLNLQYGGHIIAWFGKPWSLELAQQLPARLDRQGQVKTVIEHSIICKGTIDEDVELSLRTKDQVQNALMKAVKARIKEYLVNSH